ncbi:hypothetical protein [Sphingobacterium deserti]|uniref:Uncharacterized protein n=1 Tax=Sphingobacterium deserti TaxID=1229276 RepID=A0A0B8TBE9_9SPHI|nr:hypothetical protein [Sphingobacterium deserti]KGE16219.1 hypothetical protein DI53_0052 [Sphingobacterium deserti]
MKENLQMTIAGKAGTQSWYSVEVAKSPGFLSVFIKGMDGFRARFHVKKRIEEFEVVALDETVDLKQHKELHKKLRIIGKRFLV